MRRHLNQLYIVSTQPLQRVQSPMPKICIRVVLFQFDLTPGEQIKPINHPQTIGINFYPEAPHRCMMEDDTQGKQFSPKRSLAKAREDPRTKDRVAGKIPMARQGGRKNRTPSSNTHVRGGLPQTRTISEHVTPT